MFLALLCATSPPAAAGQIRHPGSPVQVDIVDRETGQVLPHHRHRGQDWLAAEPGHRYAVRLRNLGGARVLVVLSVDGINAIDGRTADVCQAGYVLEPWQTLEVNGWRKSLHAVAQFVFVDPAASYGARTGRPDNLGVIGVAVFREKPPAYYPRPATGIAGSRARDAEGKAAEAAAPTADAAARSEARRPGGAYGAPAPQSSVGTGHGSLEGSQAYYTAFERQGRPVQVTELRYDTFGALLARGIPVEPYYGHRHSSYPDRPRAFPGGFVPDPR
ncbi:hypothetical protein WQ53_10780 [Pseudoxanthomonas suwonensis]|uniref:Uncharacterized protein n=1 Tax=Pseudoxanthomonas suwonensis TaxID=314722 RepID=A0A0E3UPT9_9GAMM|nr:hypothetical protein WQ53_10780 [Pseudoxanthomonas suwonensis]